jgi:hypothetical protein
VTREQLDDLRFHDRVPYAGYNHYTLTNEGDDAWCYFGTTERKAIRTPNAAIDRVSLVIHYHRSFAYFKGLDDFGADYRDEPILRSDEGIFTLITRPTKLSWPGPLIIYGVDTVAANNIAGEDSWEVAIAPEGSLIERFADFSNFQGDER